MAKKIKIDIQAEALNLVLNEKKGWEDAVCWVTDKVGFNMRNMIRKFRKNYWGIFDKPKDEQTGRDKIWIPLTESLVEASVKNTDLDLKDINFRAKYSEFAEFVPFVRNRVRNYLEDTDFGEDMDMIDRVRAIDGTSVTKIIKVPGKDPKRVPVDLLNFYIDPTASSIQETPSVIERALLTKQEFLSMDGWINNKETDVVFSKNFARNDGEMFNTSGNSGETDMIEIFERWGLMPKHLISGIKDDNELVEGHIVCSSTKSGGKIHLIELNTDKDINGDIIKPYEENWYTRVQGRWYGKGIAEKVMWLQMWLNTIVNIRITRSYVSQLGLFKIRKGSGITPQMLSRLAVNGAIEVNDIQNDIGQLLVTEASVASYKDEDIIKTWSDRVTAIFDVSTGEALPSTTTATVGAIQSRSAESQFVMLRESAGRFYQRLINRHLLPKLKLKKGDVVRMGFDTKDELRQFNEAVAKVLLADECDKNPNINIEGTYQKLLADLASRPDNRYLKIIDDIPLNKFETIVYITNEEIDKAVVAQNLLQAMGMVQEPELKEELTKQLFDVMGLDINMMKIKQSMAQQPQQQMPQPQGPKNMSPIAQALAPTQQANTL